MSGYEVVIENLRQAAQAAQTAASELSAVKAADALPRGDAGMPGSKLVAELNATRAAWQDRTQMLSRGFTEVSGTLGQAVRLYRSNEQAAQAELRVPASGGPRPI